MNLFTSSSSSSLSLSPSSSSFSSSSSSTLCFDPTLCNISNNATTTTTAGCITAILRRILCSGGLPTHPSDQIREFDFDSILSAKDKKLKAKQNNPESNTNSKTSTSTSTSSSSRAISAPGIVAKLMGLEGNLEIPFKASQSSSLSRSKSMNSVDYLGDCKKKMQGRHRCEVASFHLHENESFLELRFESSGFGSREFKSKGKNKNKKNKKKKDDSCSALQEFKREKVFDLCSVNGGNACEFQGMVSDTCSDANEYFDSEAKKKEVEFVSECSSLEDSSPVSVFDFGREALETTEVDSKGVGLSWRRELTPELENELLFVLHSDSKLMVEERKIKAIESNKKERSKKKENQSQDYADIWGEICKLVENDFVGSNQIMDPAKQGEFDSISEDFESEILDQLLNELIDQL